MQRIRSTTSALALFAALSTPALANPDGAQVVAGSATVQGQGTAVVIVKQASEKTILNWDSFSIKAGELTQFLQPNAQATALNRVVGGDPSLIYGTLSANGRLVLINPNGLMIGPSGVVNANSFIASTAGIGDENFLAGKFTFDIAGDPNARIVNEGTVTAAQSGLVAFVAPSVKNSGLISAKLGTVTLGAATKFTLDFYGDQLVSFPVDAEVLHAPTGAKALIEAGGTIEGTNIVLSAQAVRGIINNVIIADGNLIARTASVVDGKIRLGGGNDTRAERRGGVESEFALAGDAPEPISESPGGKISIDGGTIGRVMIAGTLDADGARGGTISIHGEQAHITGTVRAQGATGAGGTINVLGARFVSFGGLLSADGATGGTITAHSAQGDFSLGGIATARGLAGDGGAIDIAISGESWEFGGAALDVSGATNGGTIRNIIGEKLVSSASYRARGGVGKGGTIDATAGDMFLLSSIFDASGFTDGGRVRIGGEFQGGKSLAVDELRNALTLSANDGVKIDVSSRGLRGDGGTAIVWSDRSTSFFGQADARAGFVAGSGGLVEASSLDQLVWRGAVETARNGQRGGTLLLDPKNITIAAATGGTSGGSLALLLGALYPSQPVPDGTLNSIDLFGHSIALDGTRLAIGALLDDGTANGCIDCGAVYLFTFSDLAFNGATLVGRIGQGYTGASSIDISSLVGTGDYFGSGVSLDGTRLVVGARRDDGFLNSCSDCGAAYLITFSNLAFNGGAVVGKIGGGYAGPNDIDVSSDLQAGDWFGSDVSLSGNSLAIGAGKDDGATNTCTDCGAAYLFTFAASPFTGGTLVGQIGHGYNGPGDVDMSALIEIGDGFGELGDSFGRKVSLDGTRLVVGAPLDDGALDNCVDCGAAYLFTFASSEFAGGSLVGTIGDGYTGVRDVNLAGQLNDNNLGGGGDGFGISVSLDGSLLAVGVANDQGPPETCNECGAIFLFTFSDAVFNGGALHSQIGHDYTGPNDIDVNLSLNFGDNIGNSVSLDGGRLATGAHGDDGFSQCCDGAGAAYLFTLGISGSGITVPQATFDYRPDSTVTLAVSALRALLEAGTNVVLQANNDITILDDIFVNNPLGDGGDLLLQAGRSVFINANITTDNGDITIIANENLVAGVVDIQRDPGEAVIATAAGKLIDAGSGDVWLRLSAGTGKTNVASGDITLGSITARTILVENLGTSNGDVVIGANGNLTASVTGSSIVLASLGGGFINNAGAGAVNPTGGGRFLIYAQDWTAVVLGGLTGNNLYNRNYDAEPPVAITQTGDLFIYALQPILSVSANADSRIYGEPNPAFTATITGLVNGDGAAYSYSGGPGFTTSTTSSSGVGLYVSDIAPDLGTLLSEVGYGFTFVAGSLSINPATLTYFADSMERLYGDGNPALTGTVMGLKNGETIATATTGTLTFVSAATATSNVGGYAIEGGGLTVTSANYVASILQDPSNAAALTINPATLTYVADAKSRFYGEANPALSGTMTGFKNYETIETATTGEMIFATPAGPTSGVNSYAIDGSGLTALNGNYLFVQALSNATALTINPAPLTITANDLSKTYGQLLTFTGAEFTSVGLQNGESIGGVMLASPGTAPAVDVAGSPYVIAVSGATGGTFSVANYLINYVDGVLMVTPAPVTVTANDANKFVNATLVFAGTEFSAVGLMLDHTIGSVTLTSAGAAASALVGTYSIVAADAIGGTFIPANYTFTFVDGVLTVTSGFDGQGAMMVLGDLGSGDGGSCGGNGFIGEPSCDALGSGDKDDDDEGDPLPTVDPQTIAASGG